MSTITAIAIALAAAMTVTVIERRAEVSVSPFAITAAAVVAPVRGARPLIRVVYRAANRLSAPRGRHAGVYRDRTGSPLSARRGSVLRPAPAIAHHTRDSPPADEERQEVTPPPRRTAWSRTGKGASVRSLERYARPCPEAGAVTLPPPGAARQPG
jgi:hypothetical protein